MSSSPASAPDSPSELPPEVARRGEHIPPGTGLDRMLRWVDEQQAADLHGQAGKGFTVRIHGRLERVPEGRFPALDDANFAALLRESFSPWAWRLIEERTEFDLGFDHGGRRFRANFSKQRSRQSFSFRTVPQHTMKLQDLRLPESLAGTIQELRGLVLVTGPAGQGKSTTLRALVQEINETRAVRIVTVEDPIEYVFTDARAQFEQREVGIDTASFAVGIRNAMRQDPNVIFVGEIRDRESIFAALQAAETGHLVLTTLHADSAAQAVARLREHYPAGEQDGVSASLARNLNAIICQRLLPDVTGRRVPCVEIMRRHPGLQEAIRTNQLELLHGMVEASVHEGMHSFDQYLVELLAAGTITPDTARQYAVNRHRLEMRLRGVQQTDPILRPDPKPRLNHG
ncbi:MAG: type IV pilus twitching motility protein PilT [Limisphaerales bacterium]